MKESENKVSPARCKSERGNSQPNRRHMHILEEVSKCIQRRKREQRERNKERKKRHEEIQFKRLQIQKKDFKKVD